MSVSSSMWPRQHSALLRFSLRRIKRHPGRGHALGRCSNKPGALLSTCAAALLCGAGYTSSLSALEALPTDQPDDARPADESALTFDEEVVVHGQSRWALRGQLRLAEDAFYARFNQIASSDEFNIRCRSEAPPNSLIRRRVCRPNFLSEAYSQAGQETYHRITGSQFGGDTGRYMLEAIVQQRQLDEEMRALVRQDVELQQALLRYVDIKQALEGGSTPELPPRYTIWRERSPADGALPYDAARIVEVEIGREPWSGALHHRSFTIAHVFGRIRSIELECDGRTTRLRWKRGVEWHLPERRTSCTALVTALPGASFALYEFD